MNKLDTKIWTIYYPCDIDRFVSTMEYASEFKPTPIGLPVQKYWSVDSYLNDPQTNDVDTFIECTLTCVDGEIVCGYVRASGL